MATVIFIKVERGEIHISRNLWAAEDGTSCISSLGKRLAPDCIFEKMVILRMRTVFWLAVY